MAKLLKSGENEWKVLDDNALNTDGSASFELHPLGTVIFYGGDVFTFCPEAENGVERTSGHLREIADLMDGLEKERAAAAGK